ncbi:MAG: hypothetical protein ACOX5R_04750 [bacterium]|jgi:hypothetical protein
MKDNSMSPQDSGRVAAVINVRKLVDCCSRLEQEIQRQAQEIERQSGILQELEREKQQNLVLLEMGRQQLKRRGSEILSCLRAVVQVTGERNRLKQMEEQLASAALKPDELQRIHARVMQEFQSLYPIRPLSAPVGEPSVNPDYQPDFSGYRLFRKN